MGINFLKSSNKNGKIALVEVALLLMSLIAFGYILNSEIGVVSGVVYPEGGVNKEYTVKQGDTFYSVSENYGISPDELKEMNSFDPEEPYLSPGIKIKVPNVQTGVQAAALGTGLVNKVQNGAAWYKKDLIGKLNAQGIAATAFWAASVYAGTKWITSSFSQDKAKNDAISRAVTGGYVAASIYSRFTGQLSNNALLKTLGLGGGWATLGIGVGVALVIFFSTYKKTEHKLYSFECKPWDATTGGANCEKCNEGDLPCTEYRCKSLGQGCELENKGTSEELCVWRDRGVNPAVIEPWVEALASGYKYTPDNAISPPDRGVKIIPEDNSKSCVEPFKTFSFGVTLDKPAKCKIDIENKGSFEEMDFSFSGGMSRYKHKQTVIWPSREALESENITVELGETHSLFVRCEDANGNQNDANFVFRFCVDDSPDTTPPEIVGTSIRNGLPISSNQTSIDLEVYVDEPSECKWSKNNLDYDQMENEMSCATKGSQINAQGVYICSTTLTGLKDRVNNNFFFRCEDKPWLKGTDEENNRFANTQSYPFTLVGTQPLVILDALPNNETIKDATDVVQVKLEVETTAGHNKGESLCYYSTQSDGDYIQFFNTGSYKHSQDLSLLEGDYRYFIRCSDLGGNTDEAEINFAVETDTQAPSVARAFRDGSSLKILTIDESSCVYDSASCIYEFEQGIKMKTDSAGLTHSASWDPNKNLYIKCQDEFENRPDPDKCSIIVRPFEV